VLLWLHRNTCIYKFYVDETGGNFVSNMAQKIYVDVWLIRSMFLT